MSKGSPRSREIIAELEASANASAQLFINARMAFHRRTSRNEMAELIAELGEWILERGDAKLLSAFGVVIDEDFQSGTMTFTAFERLLVVSPRDDLSISVDGVVMRPDPECPVLDDQLYNAVMARIIAWAKTDKGDARTRHVE